MKCSVAFLLVAAAFVAPLHAQLLPGAPAATTTQSLDRIVAVANDDIILQSELDEAVHSVQQQYAAHPDQLPPADILRKQVLQRLIMMRLQVQKALDQGIHVSEADVDAAVDGVAKQNNITADQLRAEIERTGSFAQFRQQLADQLMVQRLHTSVVHDSVSVTDSEVDNLLNSPTYKAGEVHIGHIQISIPSGADAAAIHASQVKAEQAETAIKGGMDFNAAAIRYSDAPDALDGGDLGWMRLDELPAAFADAVTTMQPGQVSPPMRGPTGFHIIKLFGQRQPSKQVVTDFHARQILIAPSELLSSAQAEQKAQDLYTRIVDKHEDFAKLAKADSTDYTTANLGGDMGWLQPQAMDPVIAQHLQAMKDGDVSKPFQASDGWHVVQRLGARESDVTEEVARNQARQAIGNRKSEEAYEDYLRELRANAYIKILVPSLSDTTAEAPSTASRGE
jgi:peptidyl-prolyl cis-trans isomerase SurA